MERLFVLKTLSRTQRENEGQKFVGFSLKIVRLMRSRPFLSLRKIRMRRPSPVRISPCTLQPLRRGFALQCFSLPSARMRSEGYVCPSVVLSVTTFSATTRNKAAKKRYQRVQCHTGLILKMAIFVKVLRSKVMA